ncbi:MAG: hypothetical protein KOO62_00685 [candidate division Zixibacteria bacterium]|nr:hypothetical protein [candidate division Zixibacteria bacterium]
MIVIIASVLSIVIKNFSHFESKPYLRDQGETAQVLVLCYSRNGNTEAMAKEIAKYHDADLKFIEAESYSRDFTGWYNAFIDASNETETIINPETIDMSSYDLIFLGSPIWLFRPAPPIWTFVRNNDFTNNKVILFNTFNSRFEQENIDEFGDLIVSKGGTLIDHIYIRRGRATPLQKDGNDVIMETMEILKQQWGNKVSDSSTQ